jgi:hypothetical protein
MKLRGRSPVEHLIPTKPSATDFLILVLEMAAGRLTAQFDWQCLCRSKAQGNSSFWFSANGFDSALIGMATKMTENGSIPEAIFEGLTTVPVSSQLWWDISVPLLVLMECKSKVGSGPSSWVVC